jgi:hypothetical protein
VCGLEGTGVDGGKEKASCLLREDVLGYESAA